MWEAHYVRRRSRRVAPLLPTFSAVGGSANGGKFLYIKLMFHDIKTANCRRRLFLRQAPLMPTAPRVHLPRPARPVVGLPRKPRLVPPVVSAGRGTGCDRHLPATGFSFRRWFPIARNGATLRPGWRTPFSDILRPFPPVFPRPRRQHNMFLP